MEAMTNNDVNLKQEEEQTCSLYISRAVISNHPQTFPDELSKTNLEEAIRATEPIGSWSVCQTSCGLIAAFSVEADAEKLVQRDDLTRVFQGPVQVLDANHYELLLRQGLDFFGAARFSALPERANWWRSGGHNGANAGSYQSAVTAGGGGNIMEGSNAQQPDGVLQCYRCQGFWHVAANCRHLPRCVRCGEPHSVEFCPRPRNNPICCHCSGPHHAGFRQCPVRLQLLNATPISITLATNRAMGQYTSNPAGKSNISQGQQVITPNHQP